MDGEHNCPHLSDNMLLRFLDRKHWDMDLAVEQLLAAEALRKEMGLYNLTSDMFPEMIASKSIVSNGMRDKVGRPILFVIIKNFEPINTDVDTCLRFMAYTIDKMCFEMPPNVDQILIIGDFEGVSWANYYKDHIAAIFKFLQVINSGRQY